MYSLPRVGNTQELIHKDQIIKNLGWLYLYFLSFFLDSFFEGLVSSCISGIFVIGFGADSFIEISTSARDRILT